MYTIQSITTGDFGDDEKKLRVGLCCGGLQVLLVLERHSRR